MTNSPLRVEDGIKPIKPARAAAQAMPRSLGARALRDNPARTAWIVMVLAFTTFCILAVSLPLLARSTIIHATVMRPLAMTVISGAVVMTPLNAQDARPVVDQALVTEGTRVQTDGKASATLNLYADDEARELLSTISLYNNASLVVDASRVPRFAYSTEPDRLTLRLDQGRIRVSSEARAERPIDVVVQSPGTVTAFSDGSFSVDVGLDTAEVTSRSGVATVTAADQQVIIPPGQRTRVVAGQPPAAPISVERDLLANGDFGQDLGNWSMDSFVDVQAEAADDVGVGAVQLVNRDGRRAALFTRRGQEGLHAETEIRQQLDADVLDFDDVRINFYVQLLFQSLQGAGMQSSEFPMAVQLSYTDVYGEERLWTQGFYYKDLDPSVPWPLRNVQKIPSATWYAYESPNLVELLQDTRPARLNWIRFYASGYNYESMVAEPELLVR